MINPVVELADLIPRAAAEGEGETPACGGGNEYDGRVGLRISAVFVIMIGSTLGALFPIVAKNNPKMNIPPWAMMFAKYFGSGVIICTAFIHLLSPANEALTDPCLTGPIAGYPWAQGIALMSVFAVFFVELLATRFATFSTSHLDRKPENMPGSAKETRSDFPSHSGSAADPERLTFSNAETLKENYAAQMISLFILEFGIIFHSVFIGLTLAVSGAEFVTLYIVITFHQTFEGLGLGTRLATVPLPNKWTPYAMGLGYGLTTPLSIAIGLGVRETLDPASQAALLLNGVFDAISAGILLYTGLVELMANEFLFSKTLRDAKISYVMTAFVFMALGAALMALLGKWA